MLARPLFHAGMEYKYETFELDESLFPTIPDEEFAVAEDDEPDIEGFQATAFRSASVGATNGGSGTPFRLMLPNVASSVSLARRTKREIR